MIAWGVVSADNIGWVAFSGFREEVRSREAVWQDGQWHDQLFMGILSDEVHCFKSSVVDDSVC